MGLRKRAAVLVASAALVTTVTGVATSSAATAGPARVTPASYSCGYYSGTALTESGQTGSAAQARIKEVQCLINLGFYSSRTGNAPLAVDGSFGQLTYNAVVWYQGCSGISQDGDVGTQTWYQLRNNPNC